MSEHDDAIKSIEWLDRMAQRALRDRGFDSLATTKPATNLVAHLCCLEAKAEHADRVLRKTLESVVSLLSDVRDSDCSVFVDDVADAVDDALESHGEVHIDLEGCKDILDVVARTIDGEVEYHKTEAHIAGAAINPVYAAGFIAGMEAVKDIIDKTRSVAELGLYGDFPYTDETK